MTNLNHFVFNTKEELLEFSKTTTKTCKGIETSVLVEFIKNNQGKYLFLKYANLQKADLEGANLEDANLEGAKYNKATVFGDFDISGKGMTLVD